MDTIVGSIMVLIGAAYLVFGPRIARRGVSLKYSYEELRATSGPSYRRVRRTRVVATALTMLVGAAFLAGGFAASSADIRYRVEEQLSRRPSEASASA